ncbi:hypothetical protein MSPP1_000662 [Malassezia sp. CBS 17886]|nr:hypothetical protein MSPP1_000662 [Malassezia sp. CBS 17886]
MIYAGASVPASEASRKATAPSDAYDPAALDADSASMLLGRSPKDAASGGAGAARASHAHAVDSGDVGASTGDRDDGGGVPAKPHPDTDATGAGDAKAKPTRGARACTNCHRLKMKCEGAEHGGTCQRCARGGHECVFLESHRGRKTGKRRREMENQQTLKKMEGMLMSVLENMGESRAPRDIPAMSALFAQEMGAGKPGQADAAVGSASSPSDAFQSALQNLLSTDGTDATAAPRRATMDALARVVHEVKGLGEGAHERTLETGGDNPLLGYLRRVLEQASGDTQGATPRTATPLGSATGTPGPTCLPDNTLNPLGLLAEASLQNWKRQRTGEGPSAGGDARGAGADEGQDAARGRPQFGVANETYFHSRTPLAMPRREVEADRPPELLTDAVITSEEALELFCIFFQHCSMHIFLLDPEWHTPALVCSRSPFLFTCVCAVASKFYTKRPDLYAQCLRKVIQAAFAVMGRGVKSTEIVQGFLLLTLYNQPAERYEEDRTWLFAGVAIRMAQDLNLHRKCMTPEGPENEELEREIMNRERTWYLCFCVDRTLSSQMGKPHCIREDWIIRHASEWCMQKYARPWDFGICALVDLLRVQTRQLDFLYSSTVTPSGLNLDIDYPAILPSFNAQLNETMEYWYRMGLDSMRRVLRNAPPDASERDRASESPSASSNSARTPQEHVHAEHLPSSAPAPHSAYTSSVPFPPVPRTSAEWLADRVRMSTLIALNDAGPPSDDADLTTRSMYYIARQAPLRYNYAVLVLNSFGLQYTLERPTDGVSVDKPQYLVRCVHAAKEIIATVKHGLREILRYAPDPTFVAVAYACVFLLKLIRPVFAHYINEEEVISLVTYTIEVLEEAAVDQTHTPALYASFLRSLLQARHEHSGRESHETGSDLVRPPERAGKEDARAAADMLGNPSAPISGDDAFMTVNPTQVNPVAASLAASEGPPRDVADALPPTNFDASLPMDRPGSDTGSHTEGGSKTLGWDAMQYAKAQGVDVNRVLDNSFWTSLLPPGYGSGGMDQMLGSSLDFASDFFKVPSHNPGFRTALTPGATRASSPDNGLPSTFL